MGHGGYVAGLFTGTTDGPIQVTLRRPTPLDTPLELSDLGEGRWELRDGDEVIASSEPTSFTIDVPAPPTLEVARAAEVGSPSHRDGRGVHGQCFGCGDRPAGEGLSIFAGPTEVDSTPMVAGTWQPAPWMALDDGTVDPKWVLAALDCPGAFAFIVTEVRAGLLGRIQFEQHVPVVAADEHIVTGWQVGNDGRKMFAGTAVFNADGTLLATALATWFGFPG
ncbi:MAG: hypothetical protein JJE52_06185, partial [Acidimicrobiia bacterium]|nr:hypothetical protein [Acidimicrobiia bacterium]